MLSLLFAGIPEARAQIDEDEFTAVSFRYQVREPLGPKGIVRDETIDLGLEYSLLPMISIRGGIAVVTYDIVPGAVPTPGDEVDEIVLSAAVRYYKASGRLRYFGSFGVGIFLEERQVGLMEETTDADLGLLVGGGLEWTVGKHFGLEVEVELASSSGAEPDSMVSWSIGPKFFF